MKSPFTSVEALMIAIAMSISPHTGEPRVATADLRDGEALATSYHPTPTTAVATHSPPPAMAPPVSQSGPITRRDTCPHQPPHDD